VALKVMEEIEKHLNKAYGSIEGKQIGQESKLTKDDFEKATTDYLKSAQGIVDSIIQKEKKKIKKEKL